MSLFDPLPWKHSGVSGACPCTNFFLNAGYLNFGPHETNPLPAEPSLQPRHEGFRAQSHVLASLCFLAAYAVMVLYLLTFCKKTDTHRVVSFLLFVALIKHHDQK